MVMRADEQWRVPIPAQSFLSLANLGLDVNSFAIFSVKTDKTSVLHLGIGDIGIRGIYLRVKSVSASDGDHLSIGDSMNGAGLGWRAQCVIVLGTAVHVVEGEVIVDSHFVKLSDGQIGQVAPVF